MLLTSRLTILALVAVATACGDDDGKSPADARRTADANTGADARPPDAMGPPAPDAAASTIVVTPNCTGIPAGDIDLQLTTAGLAFSPAGPHTLPIGSIIRFQTAGPHNFASAAGTNAQFVFSSGPIGAHVSCLRFTATTGGPVNFRCEQHPSMTGVLTITTD